jgi:hypothetical protein
MFVAWNGSIVVLLFVQMQTFIYAKSNHLVFQACPCADGTVYVKQWKF